MQKTSPTDKVRDESEPPSGDVWTAKRVLRSVSYDLTVPGGAAHQENNSILKMLVVAVRMSLKPMFVVKEVVVVVTGVLQTGLVVVAKDLAVLMGKAVVVHLVVSVQDQLGCLLRPLTSTSKIHNFTNQMSFVLSGSQVRMFLVAVPSVPYLCSSFSLMLW